MSKIVASNFRDFCPVCTRCMLDDPAECPECDSPRPVDGWHDIGTSSYAYLGKEVDGRYVIDRFVGAGATGDVYRAVGSRIQRPFALKIVDTRRCAGRDIEGEMARRLETEVEAMSRLRNPHVVNVYEFMQIHTHVFVMVMDYVDGVTLQERLDRTGRLAAGDAVEIVRQVANGLHEAHQRGIIHRDVKPDNIMIEQMPASGVFARILDFGIAHMVDSVRVTAGFRGTPLYASPEQCKSDGVIGAHTDVYSLGCVLFHLLTGRPPYLFERALAVMEAHVEGPIPSVYEFVSRRHVPEALDRLVGRMLAKDPRARPADAGAVVRELDALGVDVAAPTARTKLAEETSSEVGDEHTDTGSPLEDDPELQDLFDYKPSSRPRRLVHLVASLDLPERLANPTTRRAPQVLGPGGDYAVLADASRQLHLIGLKTDLAALTFAGTSAQIDAVCVDSQRGDIYAGGAEEAVFRWNLDRTTGIPAKVVGVGAPICAIDSNSMGSKLAIGTEKGDILLYDLRTQRISQLYHGAQPVRVLKFIPNSHRLLMGDAGGNLGTIPARGSAQMMQLEALDSAPVAAAISPHGDVAAVLESSGLLRVFNVMERKAYLRVEASYAPLTTLAFAADGSLNALGVTDKHLQLWLIRHEHLVQQLAEMSSALT